VLKYRRRITYNTRFYTWVTRANTDCWYERVRSWALQAGSGCDYLHMRSCDSPANRLWIQIYASEPHGRLSTIAKWASHGHRACNY